MYLIRKQRKQKQTDIEKEQTNKQTNKQSRRRRRRRWKKWKNKYGNKPCVWQRDLSQKMIIYAHIYSWK